ncbi:MAG: AraC family transcriptional regulator [bacterium]|nr:AraC family transcriptional regulator [bacterium]
MQNQTQIDRLKDVRQYIDNNFHQDLTAAQISDVACYSYRNVNRIFRAIYHESVGSYVLRLKLEKAAKEVLYSERSITEIAYEADYGDLQAFNKAFRNQYGASPAQFREKKVAEFESWKKQKEEAMKQSSDIQFKFEELPDTKVLLQPYHGPYDIQAINDSWESLIEYADSKSLITDETYFVGEILDDEEITPDEKLRYNCAITLPEDTDIEPEGFLEVKVIPAQKYAVFTHKGSYESMEKTYEIIYGEWLLNQSIELVDKPILEIYLNDESQVKKSELLTEIYVAVE